MYSLSFSYNLSLSLSPSPPSLSWGFTLPCCLSPHPRYVSVNNWWSSPTQRVTGPRENVSRMCLFIYCSVFTPSHPEKPSRPICRRVDRLEIRYPDVDPGAVWGGSWRSCCSCCDHEWVNAACLAASRTEGGKGSLNEWEVGGTEEEEWQNGRVN